MQTLTLIILFIVFMSAWYLLKTSYESYLENEPTIMRLCTRHPPSSSSQI